MSKLLIEKNTLTNLADIARVFGGYCVSKVATEPRYPDLKKISKTDNKNEYYTYPQTQMAVNVDRYDIVTIEGAKSLIISLVSATGSTNHRPLSNPDDYLQIIPGKATEPPAEDDEYTLISTGSVQVFRQLFIPNNDSVTFRMYSSATNAPHGYYAEIWGVDENNNIIQDTTQELQTDIEYLEWNGLGINQIMEAIKKNEAPPYENLIPIMNSASESYGTYPVERIKIDGTTAAFDLSGKVKPYDYNWTFCFGIRQSYSSSTFYKAIIHPSRTPLPSGPPHPQEIYILGGDVYYWGANSSISADYASNVYPYAFTQPESQMSALSKDTIVQVSYNPATCVLTFYFKSSSWEYSDIGKYATVLSAIK